jgi:hypothetical protein
MDVNAELSGKKIETLMEMLMRMTMKMLIEMMITVMGWGMEIMSVLKWTGRTC